MGSEVISPRKLTDSLELARRYSVWVDLPQIPSEVILQSRLTCRPSQVFLLQQDSDRSKDIFADLRRISQLLKTFNILEIELTDGNMRVLMIPWLSRDGLSDGSHSLLRGTLALA